MSMLRLFFWIKIAHSKHEVVLSQRKYTLDLLLETGLLGCKPLHTLMDTDVGLCDETGPLFRMFLNTVDS